LEAGHGHFMGDALAWTGAGDTAKVDLPALPCEFLDEELVAATLSPSFDVDAILGQIDEECAAFQSDATVPTTPPPVAAAAAAAAAVAATAVAAVPAKVARTTTSIRTLTKAEILSAVESNDVLLADRRQWANMMTQAEQVLSPNEVAELKKRRRRAKGVVDAQNARKKKKKGTANTDVQFKVAIAQNEALTAKVAQMAADNAALQKELAALRSQLTAANNTPQ